VADENQEDAAEMTPVSPENLGVDHDSSAKIAGEGINSPSAAEVSSPIVSVAAPPPPPAAPGSKFCPACGTGIVATAAICPNCGTSVGQPKSKTTAILLAVFLTFWTWLYTYKKDAWKFWVGLVANILTLGIASIIVWPWAIIDAAIKNDDYYQQFPNG